MERTGIAFHEAMQDSDYCFFGESNISPEWLLLRLRESLATLLALVTLDLITAFSGLYRFDSADLRQVMRESSC